VLDEIREDVAKSKRSPEEVASETGLVSHASERFYSGKKGLSSTRLGRSTEDYGEIKSVVIKAKGRRGTGKKWSRSSLRSRKGAEK